MTAIPLTHEAVGARICALRMLCGMGWNYLGAADCLAARGSTRDVLLRPRFVEILATRRFDYRGVVYPLSPGGIDQVLRELATIRLDEGLLAANERLYAKLVFGITVTEFMPDGGKHQVTVPLIDWTDTGANRFDVTEEMRTLSTQGTHERAPAIVGYVNGIPLVVIEAGQGSGDDAMVHEGIREQRRNQRHDEIPHLFAYAQLLMSLSATGGRYGTTHTPPKSWASWSVEEEFDDAHLRALKSMPLPAAIQAALCEGRSAAARAWIESPGSFGAPDGLDRLLAGLLKPRRLLDLLRCFVLFDSRAGKIVARHQQFFAVRALLKRLSAQRPDGSREGGVVWHATGSGKSLTMVFLSKALLLDDALKECRLLVITDRRELEQQLARNFMTGGAFGSSIAAHREGERSKALTGRDLARRIGQGTKRITFALVQKFGTASRLPGCRNDSPDLVVLVDEGHRSHGGEWHARMRKALPRAACVAFTGTPLLRGEKTARKFGPIVHAYTMLDAIRDHAVVPLLYEERVPELAVDAEAADRWFDRITTSLAPAQRAALKKKYARGGAVHGAARRIELIAWDIATHFHVHFRKAATGLKGQVATASKLDAIRFKTALDATGLVTSAVVISPPDMPEGDSTVDEEAMPEVRRWWKQNLRDLGVDATQHERQVLQAFGSDGGPDLLVVVDRLLTGFDEARNAVLYIDKPLKGHSLIQAVARVNRLHDAKPHGLLVDYRGILKELDTAIRAYRDVEGRTQGGFDVEDLEGLYAQAGAGPSTADLPTLTEPRQAAQSDAMETADLGRYSDQVRQLVDGTVAGTGVREPDSVYALHELGMPEPAGAGARDAARHEADLRRAREHASIAVEPADDPSTQKVFTDLLKDAIAQAEALFDQSGDQALAISRVVQAAAAEHSLNPQNMESAIRRNLLPLLYAPLGLDRANEVIGRVLQIARVGSTWRE